MNRKLVITQNVTVDGSIEMLGDWFDPQGQGDVDSSDVLAELHRREGISGLDEKAARKKRT